MQSEIFYYSRGTQGGNDTFYYVMLFIGIGVITAFIIRGQLFKKKYNKILVDMSYDEVISLIGPPNNTDSSGAITTCMWKVRISRNYAITRIIVFKDNKVFSFLSDR